MTVVDPELIKEAILELHSLLKILPIARCFGRPDGFSERAESGKGHVFDMVERGHVFSPDVGLSAEDVVLELGRQIGRHGLKGIDLFQWQIAADGMWLG